MSGSSSSYSSDEEQVSEKWSQKEDVGEKWSQKEDVGEVDLKQRAYTSLAKWKARPEEPLEMWMITCSMLTPTTLSVLMESYKGLVFLCAQMILKSTEGRVLEYTAKLFPRQASIKLLGWIRVRNGHGGYLHPAHHSNGDPFDYYDDLPRMRGNYKHLLRFHGIAREWEFYHLEVVGAMVATVKQVDTDVRLAEDGSCWAKYRNSDWRSIGVNDTHIDTFQQTALSSGNKRLWMIIFNMPQLRCMVEAKDMMDIFEGKQPSRRSRRHHMTIAEMLVQSFEHQLRAICHNTHPSTLPSKHNCDTPKETVEAWREVVQQWIFDQAPHIGIKPVLGIIQGLEKQPWEAFNKHALGVIRNIITAMTHTRNTKKWQARQAVDQAKLTYAKDQAKKEEALAQALLRPLMTP